MSVNTSLSLMGILNSLYQFFFIYCSQYKAGSLLFVQIFQHPATSTGKVLHFSRLAPLLRAVVAPGACSPP